MIKAHPVRLACPVFPPLGGVSSVPLKNAKTGLCLLGGLKPTLRGPNISAAWRCFFRTAQERKKQACACSVG